MNNTGTTPLLVPVKRAFLIGVTDYGDPERNLDFCARDVDALANVLERKGFVCKKWVDQPLRQVVEDGELATFVAAAVHQDDDIVFYFSGHGLDVGGEQLLQGKGVQLNNLKNALHTDDLLRLSEVMECLAGSPARKMLIVDACRVAPAAVDVADDLQRMRRTALQEVKNCAVVFASVDGTKAWGSPSNDGSRFTMALVEELKQYGRGLMSVVEATMERVNSVKDINEQTPWIYSSMRDRSLDAYRITMRTADRDSFPKHLVRRAASPAWAILSGAESLAELRGEKLHPLARLPKALQSSILAYEPSSDGAAHLLVKGFSKSLHRLVVQKAPNWRDSAVQVHRLTAQSLRRIFGALWSSLDQRILAFGRPTHGKEAIRIWRLESEAMAANEAISGLPQDVECNAACWLSEDEALVACCRDTASPTCVFILTRKGAAWAGQLLWTTTQPLRVTKMRVLARSGVVALGADDGSIAVVDLAMQLQPRFYARPQPFSGHTHMSSMPWSGSSRSGDDRVQRGVGDIAEDVGTGLLGITYFDSTIAFFDPVLSTFVDTFTLPSRTHLPHIVCTEPGLFMTDGSGYGQVFEIQRC